MTSITLPPDLESWLADEARRRGATVEQVALEKLRTGLPSQAVPITGTESRPTSDRQTGEGTMFEFLQGYIGTLEGPNDLSTDTGRQFAELLDETPRPKISPAEE